MQHIGTPEEWRDIPGYEGRYQVSNHGQVRSCDRLVPHKDGTETFRKGRTLRPHKNRGGYLMVSLGSRNNQSVHRLVAQTFIGPIPEGMLVCHWNDVPDDNRVENLRIGNYVDNGLDSIRTGKHQSCRRTHCPHGHEYTPENTYINKTSGARICRACARAQDMKRRDARRNYWKQRRAAV